MKHTLVLGIEHLMTGIQLVQQNVDCRGFQFIRESASMVRVESDAPFEAHWPNRSHLTSLAIPDQPFATYYAGDGEVDWYAKRIAGVMAKADQRSYGMQRYTRKHDEMPECCNEPAFTQAVVEAMRRKHGAEADNYLAMLRWNRDHWFYCADRMYIGVEVDGSIHT